MHLLTNRVNKQMAIDTPNRNMRKSLITGGEIQSCGRVLPNDESLEEAVLWNVVSRRNITPFERKYPGGND
jgi:hypothetical protein